MTIEDLGNLGDLIAAIATIATLGYLAYQIRRNTKSAQGSTAEAILENEIQLITSFPLSRSVTNFCSMKNGWLRE